MPISLTVTQGPAIGKIFIFTEPDCLLFGKAQDAHIVIEGDPMVSRQHFTLVVEPPVAKLRDHSLNGTYIGRKGSFVRYGAKIEPPKGAMVAPNGENEVVLLHGDEISIGQTRISVNIEISCAECNTVIPSDDKFAKVDEKTYLCAKCRQSVATVVPLTPEMTEVQAAAPAFDGTMVQSAAPSSSKSQQGEVETVKAADIATKQTVELGTAATLKDAHSQQVIALPNAPVFPGYTITALLGRGGMGMVFKAIQHSTGRSVAIKTILPAKSGAEKMFTLFQREIEIQQKLKHPNIVELLSLERVGSMLGVVLELVEGMDLAKFIQSRGGRVSLQEAAPILKGTLEGLAHAHAAGVIHRDLKPENIFLAQTATGWIPKLADFGLAKKYENSGKSLLEVAGTPPYWPREHITLYKSLYPSSDVFSIAAVFYFMLTGQHARATMSEMINKQKALKRHLGAGDYCQCILNNPVVPINQVSPEMPLPVAQVLMKALSESTLGPADETNKDIVRQTLAELRFPNAGAFRDALGIALRRMHL